MATKQKLTRNQDVVIKALAAIGQPLSAYRILDHNAQEDVYLDVQFSVLHRAAFV